MHAPAACRQTRSLCDRPLIDLLDLPVLLGDREKNSRWDDLAVSPDHTDQKLFAAVGACRERDDRLCVQNHPVFVERVSDPSDPGQRVEFSLGARPSGVSSVVSWNTTTTPRPFDPVISGAEE